MRHQIKTLRKARAGNVPLSPLSFLPRAESLHGARRAVIDCDIRRSWAEPPARIRAVAGDLAGLGVLQGDKVSVSSPNIPELFELHFALPLTGAALNTLNTRPEPETIADILDRADTKLVILDREPVPLRTKIFVLLGRTLPAVEIADPGAPAESPGGPTCDALTSSAPLQATLPDDEWDAIALDYTSGTSERPKGVVHRHRGAYLKALGPGTAWQVPRPSSCRCWPRQRRGQSRALRSRDPRSGRRGPAATLRSREDPRDGFDVMQVYGLRETCGQVLQYLWHDDWADLGPADHAELQAQQGIAVCRAVIFETLPKTSTGKIQKFQLRNRAKDLE